MKYRREILLHGDYFAEFYDEQSAAVRKKINYVFVIGTNGRADSN